MAGFVDISAVKRAKAVKVVWPMHYLEKMTKIFNGNPIVMPTNDTTLKKGQSYDLFQVIVQANFEYISPPLLAQPD